ncbi:MAG TPA: response regulator transcription factor [Rubrobacter sp.]|nr:response regulator transcription factor [Rubrobacter sp.]
MGGNRNTNGPIRVLLADDHTLFRQGLARILASFGGMEVVAEVPNDADALKLARELSPDVVIMQVQLPFERAIETLEAMRYFSDPPEGGDRHHVRDPQIPQGAHRGGGERLLAEDVLLGAPGGGRQGGGARPLERERRRWDA